MSAELDHIAVIVEDAELAKKWFATYLGFDKFILSAPMKATGSGGTRHLIRNECGNVLELIEYIEPQKNDVGVIQHIGFTVDCLDDFYQTLEIGGQLKQNEAIKDLGKAKILYFLGIYNIGIELIEKREN